MVASFWVFASCRTCTSKHEHRQSKHDIFNFKEFHSGKKNIAHRFWHSVDRPWRSWLRIFLLSPDSITTFIFFRLVTYWACAWCSVVNKHTTHEIWKICSRSRRQPCGPAHLIILSATRSVFSVSLAFSGSCMRLAEKKKNTHRAYPFWYDCLQQECPPCTHHTLQRAAVQQ